MKDLQKAMQVEQQLRDEGKYNIRSLAPLIKEFGYNTSKEYLEERDTYLFQNWKPEVVNPSMESIQEFCLNSIKNGEDKIIIPYGDGLHAWHGTAEIDYDLCKELGIQVIDLGYEGGTIIGSEKDLSMMVIMPSEIKLGQETVLNKVVEILSKYIPNVTWVGNDILINEGKVCGITYRELGSVIVFTAQFSFDDYSEYIEKICNKKSTKTPSFINSELLTKDQLEKEILDWLVNKA